MLSFVRECKITVLKAEVAAGATEIADAAVVDMQGFESVAFVVMLGAETVANAKVTLSAVAGNDSALADGAAKEVAATHTVAGATSGDDKLLVLDAVKPGARYVRAKVKRETANAEVLAILAVQYGADALPVKHGADVLAAALSVG